jgi:hypothetical protein
MGPVVHQRKRVFVKGCGRFLVGGCWPGGLLLRLGVVVVVAGWCGW